MLGSARSDQEKAAAVGYCSHLFVDVIAHNHFVPSHERRWGNVPKLSHAMVEWAMDAHLKNRVSAWPAEVLRAEQKELVDYVTEKFSCQKRAAEKTLRMLTRAEALLRSTGLPEACYRLGRSLDGGLTERFDQYALVTTNALPQIERVLTGIEPSWNPEGASCPISPVADFVVLLEG